MFAASKPLSSGLNSDFPQHASWNSGPLRYARDRPRSAHVRHRIGTFVITLRPQWRSGARTPPDQEKSQILGIDGTIVVQVGCVFGIAPEGEHGTHVRCVDQTIAVQVGGTGRGLVGGDRDVVDPQVEVGEPEDEKR